VQRQLRRSSPGVRKGIARLHGLGAEVVERGLIGWLREPSGPGRRNTELAGRGFRGHPAGEAVDEARKAADAVIELMRAEMQGLGKPLDDWQPVPAPDPPWGRNCVLIVVMGVRRPDRWSYPERCSNGHEWGPCRVIVSWRPCHCPPAVAADRW
jgi:hypothetical protein